MKTDKSMTREEDCQTKYRGTNDDEYQIYVASAEALGWDVKSYDDWLGS
ncbi:MAG: hypothetical protein ABGX83_05415 [Nitrospira sp.]